MMRNANNELVWNLGLRQESAKVHTIVMPDNLGEFNIDIAKYWPAHSCVISWPVNPHFTGISGIANILRETSQYKGHVFKSESGIEIL